MIGQRGWWASSRTITRRLGWGVLDQAVSSLENFALGVYVAKVLGAASLGALSMAFFAYSIILNASRALCTDPLMVRYSGLRSKSWRNAVGSSGGMALLVGVTGGAVCLAVGAVLTSEMPHSAAGTAFLALAIVLPGLTLQDSYRYAFFAAGEGSRTCVNDAVWTLLLVIALFLGLRTGPHGIAWALISFGGTATLAAGLGMIQAGVMPRPWMARQWIQEHWSLGPRFLVENVTLGTATQVRSLIVAATAGLAAAGAVRGAEMLVGPVVALLMGIAQVAVPEGARSLKRGSQALMRLCLVLSLGLALVALAWDLVLLIVFPHGVGQIVLGSVWPATQVLVPGIAVIAVAGCLHVGPSAGLRTLGRADKSMRCQLQVTSLLILLGSSGALLGGAQGAVWGTAVATVLGAGIWWTQFARALRAHSARKDSGSPARDSPQADYSWEPHVTDESADRRMGKLSTHPRRSRPPG